MKAAPDVSRRMAAPDVSRRTSAPALLVLLMLCVCEVVGAQESPPSLSDVMREVHGLKGMVGNLTGAKADDLANLTDSYNQLQTKFDQLQSRYQQFCKPLNPVTETPDDRRWRMRKLCDSSGFTWDGVVCYYLSTPSEQKSWAESRRFCTDRQADLMIMNSQEKQDLVDRVAPSDRVWIGLTDRDTEGSFKWVDGKPLSSPTFWYLGYPRDTRGDHDCVYYYNAGGSSRGWFDYTCYSSWRWICERVVQ